MASIEIIGYAYSVTDPTLVDNIFRALKKGKGEQTLILRASLLGKVAVTDPENGFLEEGLFVPKKNILPINNPLPEENLTILPITLSLDAKSMLSFGDIVNRNNGQPYGTYELSSADYGTFNNYRLLTEPF